jgi:hypothetical protein
MTHPLVTPLTLATSSLYLTSSLYRPFPLSPRPYTLAAGVTAAGSYTRCDAASLRGDLRRKTGVARPFTSVASRPSTTSVAYGRMESRTCRSTRSSSRNMRCSATTARRHSCTAMSMRAPLSFNTIFRQVRGTPLMQTRHPRDPPPPNSTTASPSTVVHGPNQTGSQIFEPFFSILKLQWQTPRHCLDLCCRWGGAGAAGWGRPSPTRTGPCPVSCPEKSS